jgi:hypothetical protein
MRWAGNGLVDGPSDMATSGGGPGGRDGERVAASEATQAPEFIQRPTKLLRILDDPGTPQRGAAISPGRGGGDTAPWGCPKGH